MTKSFLGCTGNKTCFSVGLQRSRRACYWFETHLEAGSPVVVAMLIPAGRCDGWTSRFVSAGETDAGQCRNWPSLHHRHKMLSIKKWKIRVRDEELIEDNFSAAHLSPLSRNPSERHWSWEIAFFPNEGPLSRWMLLRFGCGRSSEQVGLEELFNVLRDAALQSKLTGMFYHVRS